MQIVLSGIKNIIPVEGQAPRKHFGIFSQRFFTSTNIASCGMRNELSASLYYEEPENKFLGTAPKKIPIENYLKNGGFCGLSSDIIEDTIVNSAGEITDLVVSSRHFYSGTLHSEKKLNKRKPIYRIHMFTNECTCLGFLYDGKCKHNLVAKKARETLRYNLTLVMKEKFGFVLAIQLAFVFP